MGGYLLLLGFLFCGVVIAGCLFRDKSRICVIWIGMSMGLLLMMWLPAIYALILGSFTRTATLLGLLSAVLPAGIALCVTMAARNKSETSMGLRFLHRGGREGLCADLPPVLLLALVVPLALLSAYLQYSHTLRDVGGALHVGQSTYGDLNLHLGIATSARNASFPLMYSILPGTPLGYPFLSDTMVTSMLLCGGDPAGSFIVSGTWMMLLVYLGYVMLAWELTKKKAAVVLAFVLMFLNGGLGFLYTFDGVMSDSSMLREVFTGFYKTPTNMPELNLRWVNVICDMMVPQRTLLCGWMLLLPAFYMLVDAVRTRRLQGFAVLGIWAGLMPMAHTHSFLALGIASAGLMLQQLLSTGVKECKKLLVGFAIYAAAAIALALPQLLTWTFPQTIGGGSLTLRFNWVNNRGDGHLIDGYFWFWIKNVGLVYILMLPAALSMRKGSVKRGLCLGALMIYAVAELIQFQPNPYDNNKLFYVAYMLMLPCVGEYLSKLWTRLKGVRGRALLAAAFMAASTVSAGLAIARELVSDYMLFSAEEVRAAAYIEANTPEHSTVLTGDQHNNVVAALTGRNIVCGTASFLYYHGVDYSEQQYAQQCMLSAPAEHLELFDQYQVDYVYMSSQEIARYNADTAWFEQECEKLYDAGGIRIYAAPRADAPEDEACYIQTKSA